MKDSHFQSSSLPNSNGSSSPSSGRDSLTNARRDRDLQQRIIHLESIFDNLPDAVIVTDFEGHKVFSNLQAQLLLGKPPADIPIDQWSMEMGFFLDDGETYYPGSRMPIARALNGEMVVSEEMVMKSPSAPRPIWISMSAQPLLGLNGTIDGAVVVFRDVSYRKQVEFSRERHSQRAEALYRLSKTIAEVGDDVNQVLTIAAMHASEMIGDACVASLVSDELERVDIQAAYHPNPNSRALLREMMLSQSHRLEDGIIGGVVRSGEPLVIPSIAPQQLAAITLPSFSKFVQLVGVESILIVPLKGRDRVLGTLSLSRDSGRPAYTANEQSFLEDIARRTALAVENCSLFDSLRSQIFERRLAEKALQQSEERFRSIFFASALGIKVLDLDGEMLQANPALQQMLGRTYDELVGRHFTACIHPDDIEPSISHLENLISGRLKETSLDHRLLHKNGTIVWVRATFAGVKENQDGDAYRYVVVIVENITESKKIASELLEMKARLLSRVEMERLSLAQDLHDGPMQDLHSVVYQFGALREMLPPEQHERLDGVRATIQQVVQDLRATAKELRPPTIMDFGLANAIRSHADEFREKHPELQIELFLTSDHQLLSKDVRLALFRIYQQALMNVVRHAQATKVTVRFTLDAEEVTLEIVDDGRGFIVPHRWVTLTRMGHFGLAGAAERVETLSGVFNVVSAPGDGARLEIRIPAVGGQWESHLKT